MNILKFDKRQYAPESNAVQSEPPIIGTDWSNGNASSSITGDRGEPGIIESIRGHRAGLGLILSENSVELRAPGIPSSQLINESNGDANTIQYYIDILRNLIDAVAALQDFEGQASNRIDELQRRLSHEHTKIQ